jgi:hypothetical protein
MFKNYFIVALRQIKKNRGFSLLNILGLTIGLTCAILISLWVQDEVSYNKFHKKYEHRYQVFEKQNLWWNVCKSSRRLQNSNRSLRCLILIKNLRVIPKLKINGQIASPYCHLLTT